MSAPRRPDPEVGGDALPLALRSAMTAVDDHKGEDLLVLDLREIASFTDYLLICHGRGERQVQAIADAILERLHEQTVKPLHTEGYKQASWILIDYVDFLVNVFTPETREFYQLERVWRDAPVAAGERQDALGEGAGASTRS